MKTRVKSNILFSLCILLLGAFIYIGAFGVTFAGYKVKTLGETIKRGLDLQGGVTILEEIVSDEEVPDETLERTKELLSSRVNKMGVSETTVTTEGGNRIRIDIPGVYDSNSINETLTKTGRLTFRDPSGNELLTGSDVQNATAYLDNQGKATISLEMNEQGKQKFAEATAKFIGQSISIYMDDEVLTSPTVEAVISDGKAIITGSASLDEAKNVAAMIQSGALPVTLKLASVKTVGATLGQEALPNSLKAGAVGVSLIFLLMLTVYRRVGIFSCISLAIYILLVLYSFIFLDVTLTLPGIAGLLLTIGMAVDANVLTFERIKEELRNGKSAKSSVQLGFDKALSSILDSNITTIISALVLYYLGSGVVKGFALTLLVGVVISMFSGIVITRFFVRLALKMGVLDKREHFGVRGGKNNA